MATTKDFTALKKSAIKQGWVIEKTRKGHLKWKSPVTGEIIVSEGTGGDWRGYKNHLSRIRNAGYVG